MLLVSAIPFSLSADTGENVDAAPAIKQDTDASPSVEMEATVTEVGKRLLVEVTKSEYTSGPHVVLVNESTVIQDASGTPLCAQSIKIGDKLTVLCSGQVMLSYPPQIVAIRIIVQ